MNWSDEQIEYATIQWRAGDSASQIARAMSGPSLRVSRNAVISKLHRLGICGSGTPARHNPTNRSRKFISAPGPRLACPRLPEPIIQQPALVLDNGAHVGLEDLKPGMCKFPIGDPHEADFHYCGCTPKPASVYCPAHHRVCYVPDTQPRSHRRRDFQGPRALAA